MSSSARYWMMLVVLVSAISGLAMLSHGEATPAALPLTQFPKQIEQFSAVADIPFDKDTLEILKPSDYLNRVYYEPGVGGR